MILTIFTMFMIFMAENRVWYGRSWDLPDYIHKIRLDNVLILSEQRSVQTTGNTNDDAIVHLFNSRITIKIQNIFGVEGRKNKLRSGFQLKYLRAEIHGGAMFPDEKVEFSNYDRRNVNERQSLFSLIKNCACVVSESGVVSKVPKQSVGIDNEIYHL